MKAPPPGTKLAAVYAAVLAGWESTPDIAEELGLPHNHVSAYLATLAGRGLIRVAFRKWGCNHGGLFHRYAPVAPAKQGAAA